MTTKSSPHAAKVQAAITRRRFTALAGAAGLVAGAAPFHIGRAQGAPLKVGVLLPRSGAAGGHRAGLPARRRDRARDPQAPGPAGPRHHERRHRDQRRGRPLARRAADRRGRAAPGRRLQLRPEHRDCPGRRAEGHSLRHQHRRRPAHHRAGLQVRVPQFPDRGDDPRRCLRQPEGALRGCRLGAEVGGVHACQRHLRHLDAEGHRWGV